MKLQKMSLAFGSSDNLFISTHIFETPWGEGRIVFTKKGVKNLFLENFDDSPIDPLLPWMEEVVRNLIKYFRGERVEFKDVPLDIEIPEWAKNVLEIIKEIPYGSIKTYGEIAKIANLHPRKVGMALKLNPVPVIIPCHRVVAKNGPGGYSQGVNWKLRLLQLEGSLKLIQRHFG